jgi:hypothetical protein
VKTSRCQKLTVVRKGYLVFKARETIAASSINGTMIVWYDRPYDEDTSSEAVSQKNNNNNNNNDTIRR